MGWDETLFRPWRKEILSANQRGPVELGLSPTFDPKADPDAPIVCQFKDGTTFEVAHITMVPYHQFVQAKQHSFPITLTY